TEATGKGIGELGSSVEGHQHSGPGGLAMRILDKARLRLRSLCRRPNVDFELEAELQFHLDQPIEETISSGMPPEEARRAARRMLEGVIEHISRRRTMCQPMMQNVKRAVLLGLGVL